jgi:hypothetical protein
MSLCGSRNCGCAITSESLSVEGSGTGADPWRIEIAAVGDLLQGYSFPTSAARDAALPAPDGGQPAWTRDADTLWVSNGSEWLPLEQPWQSYTPVVSNTWAIGNGSALGRYKQIGKLVYFTVKIVWGSSSTFGASYLTISLPPVNASTSIAGFDSTGIGGTRNDDRAIYLDVSIVGTFRGNGDLNSASTVALYADIADALPYVHDTGVIQGAPFTWAASDIVSLFGVYEAA